MELIVFDLDGTLLNSRATVSTGTRDTLAALADKGVAYTVATGRSLHASRDLLEGLGFILPQAYKNGVMIWDPGASRYSHQTCLTLDEVEHVITAVLAQNVTPFVSTLEPGQHHGLYHPPVQNDVEAVLVRDFTASFDLGVRPLAELPADAEITNVSAIGTHEQIRRVRAVTQDEPHLVAYSGEAWEGKDWCWIDIHHTEATKGGAIRTLKEQLGFSRVVCFGDGENDLSMFEAADEAYAPDNAEKAVKDAATAVIGHHDEDGVAAFLRERFSL